MEHRTPEEYRALIRGWRIRLKEKPFELSTVLGEMQEEVPDYIPQPIKVGKGGEPLPRETIGH